jgi:integrase
MMNKPPVPPQGGHVRTKAKRSRQERCLQPDEVVTVVTDLKRKAKRTALASRHLILFRLACGCGLRVSEIIELKIGDVDLDRLDIHVRNGKGSKARTVPIWDRGTLDDLREWIDKRRADGATNDDLVLVTRNNTQLNRSDASGAFAIACRILNRPVAPTIHDGRHTFLSNALHKGKPLTAVQAAAGHERAATTSTYLHEIGRDRELIDLFN